MIFSVKKQFFKFTDGIEYHKLKSSMRVSKFNLLTRMILKIRTPHFCVLIWTKHRCKKWAGIRPFKILLQQKVAKTILLVASNILEAQHIILAFYHLSLFYLQWVKTSTTSALVPKGAILKLIMRNFVDSPLMTLYNEH